MEDRRENQKPKHPSLNPGPCRTHGGSLSIPVYCCCLLSRVLLFTIPWTVPCQAPLSMGFPNTGVGCHFLLQGIVPTKGLNLHLLQWQVDSLLSKSPQKPISVYTGYNEDLPPAPGGTLRLTQDDGQSFAKRVFCKNSIRSTS